jgi:hypothetical protein
MTAHLRSPFLAPLLPEALASRLHRLARAAAWAVGGLAAGLPFVLGSQVPAAINYQGKLTDNNGDPVKAGYYEVQFRIWDHPTQNGGGNYIWGRVFPLHVVTNGMFNVLLTDDGDAVNTPGNPKVPSLLEAFGADTRYLGLTVTRNPDNPITSPVEISPRQRLASAPYAIGASLADHARYATNAFHADNADLATKATTADNASKVGNLSATEFLRVSQTSQTLTGSLTVTGGNLTVTDSLGVGVGTISPAQLLQVGNNTTPNSQGMIRLASRSGTGGANRIWDLGVPENDEQTGGKSYSFVIDDTQLGTDPEFMIKWGTGNVGIGTTAPDRPLTVRAAGAQSIQWLSFQNATNVTKWHLNHLSEGLNFAETSQMDGRLFLKKGGGVGINTTSPEFTLHVIGTIAASSLPKWDKHNVQWDSSTGQIGYDDSTRRHKENIRPLAADWRALLEAQPMTYTRPGDPDRWEIGFIAEDFDALGLDPLVLYDEAGEPEALHYDKISLYLVEIAKAQQQELEASAARIQALEQRVAELKGLVQALAGQLENRPQ